MFAALGALVDVEVGAAARAMRARSGVTWSELGRAVGTTKQGAQQRYGKP